MAGSMMAGSRMAECMMGVTAIAGSMMVVTAIAGTMMAGTMMAGAITRPVADISPFGSVAGTMMEAGTSVSTTMVSAMAIARAISGFAIASVGAKKSPCPC